MFPSPRRSQNVRQIERSRKKRNNSTSSTSSSSASRFSPYPPVLCPLDAFPEQESEVSKTCEDCCDCLRPNRGAVDARPSASMATEDDQKSSIVSASAAASDAAAMNARTRGDNTASHSYIGMIATAILATPEAKLTLDGIYRYMEGQFSSILVLRAGWRNTVRHNLSLHDCFVKGEIAAEGKGRFWRIHPNYLEQFKCGKFNKNLLRSALPVFYPAANFHFSAPPHMGGSSPNFAPLRASVLSTNVSPMFPTSMSPMIPTSYPYMSPMSQMSFTRPSPCQDLPFYQHSPSTKYLSNQREHCESRMFPYQRCPRDSCNACTRVRQWSLPNFFCPSYEINPTIENGAMSFLGS